MWWFDWQVNNKKHWALTIANYEWCTLLTGMVDKFDVTYDNLEQMNDVSWWCYDSMMLWFDMIVWFDMMLWFNMMVCNDDNDVM